MISRDSLSTRTAVYFNSDILPVQDFDPFWFYTRALDETGLLSQVYDENGPYNLRQTIGLIVEKPLNP